MIYPDEFKSEDSCFQTWMDQIEISAKLLPAHRMWKFFKKDYTVDLMVMLLKDPGLAYFERD